MLIQQEVEKLINKGEVSKIPKPHAGFYSNMFLVPKDGGLRPVVNLKALNQHVHTQHFKMEGIHTLKELIRPRDWLAKEDLKDAYFSIPIHQDLFLALSKMNATSQVIPPAPLFYRYCKCNLPIL